MQEPDEPLEPPGEFVAAGGAAAAELVQTSVSSPSPKRST